MNKKTCNAINTVKNYKQLIIYYDIKNKFYLCVLNN